MFTDPNHLRVEDPGNVDGNPVFIYLDAFSKEEHFAKYLPEYKNLDELKAHYKRGGLGDVKVKKFLNNVLEEELKPIRERRIEFAKDIPSVYKMLEEGSKIARQKACKTLEEMKNAMKINYFADKELIESQIKKFG
jgi:tryptophanyl-tRNA synthetase